VVGATYPRQLAAVREVAGTLPILVPGVGAQGGDVAAAVAAGVTPDGTGMLVSSSRDILYASSGDDFAAAARRKAVEMVAAIDAAATDVR
jgi:orotidine-5'-phosphate decarboxylase